MDKAPSLADVLHSDHAPLVFADRNGTLRDTRVATLWKSPDEAHFCPRTGTMSWNERAAITNDATLLAYLCDRCREVPAFPAAGDRPACFLDPGAVRVGLVNTGGPAPGLCMVNDSITKRHFALAGNATPVVFGYRGGFRGLQAISGSPTGKFRLVPAKRYWKSDADLVTDDRALEPVTFLGSSRFDIRSPENLERVIDGIIQDRLDILYVVGGNGSQAAAQRIKKELAARNYLGPQGYELVVIGGPKTMDNDLLFADTTFGFQTTVDHTVDAVSVFHNTIECLGRVGMMQVFGAASGFVALNASYCSGLVDYPVVPEVVEREGIWALCRDQKLAADVIDEARFVGAERAFRAAGLRRDEVFLAGLLLLMKHLQEVVAQRHDEKEHALIVVAEGAKGLFAHSGAGQELMPFAEMVRRLSDFLNRRPQKPHGDVQVTPLEPTYLIRDNRPRSYDIALCKFIGKAMVDAALAGYTDCLVTRWCGSYVLVPMSLATAMVNLIDPTDYFYRSMATRFKTTLDRNYVATHWPSLSAEFYERYTERLKMQVRSLATTVFSSADSAQTEAELAKVGAAMNLAVSAHAGATRKDGAPYITHPCRVAIAVLSDMKAQHVEISSSPVAAALLHDVLEDAVGRVTEEAIVAACGDETLTLVKALTGPSKKEVPDAMQRSQFKAAAAEAAGPVAMRLKLIDRLDNLNDALRIPENADGSAFRTRYCHESKSHFVPLASSLGDPELQARLEEAILFLEESQ